MRFFFSALNAGLLRMLSAFAATSVLVLVGGIRVLRANGAAVSFTQCVDELAQRHTFFTEESVANVEHGLLIRIGKPETMAPTQGSPDALGA